ncbi:MAG: translocation/assembly module TamB domain-containing protein [Bacteroidota bacterium]
MLVLLSVPALSLLFLQNRHMQTIISRFAADKLSEELGTTISLSSVNYSFFNRIQVRDLYIEDQRGDTLLYSEITRFRLKTLNPSKAGIEIRKILLENARIYFATDSSGRLNLEFITDRIRNMGKKDGSGSTLIIKEIEAVNSVYRQKFNTGKPPSYGIDFTDLEVNPVHALVKDLEIKGDTVRMNIDRLEGREKSGFVLENFSSGLLLTSFSMEFTDVSLEAPESELHLPLIGFSFNDWRAFQHVYDSVNIHFIAEPSSFTLGDLAYVVPVFEGFSQPVMLEGELSGKFSDLRSRNLKIIFNNHSRVDLSMIMIGLPDVRNTLMHFSFTELSTSLDDFNQVFRSAGLQPLNLPETIDPSGEIVYKGKFTGYPDDFVAFGHLATELGDMVLDLSIKPDTGNSLIYHGKLETEGFKLGKLLDREDLIGDIDMNVFVDGRIRDAVASGEMDGEIASLIFNDYRYRNIQIKGALSNRKFDGYFTVRDPNIQMEFTGKMDFTTEIPVFNFTADVSRARPYFLNLDDNDPDFFASFLLKTNFSGKKLDEINGNIRLINSFFGRNDKQLQVYDLTLEAQNTAQKNHFSLRSDLVDAEMNGRFSLSSLPGSMKNMINHYIGLFPPEDIQQDSTAWFDFDVELKNLAPLMDFFFPDYQVSNYSTVKGHYDLANDHLSTTCNIPYFYLGKNRFNDFRLITDSDSVSFHAQSSLSSIRLSSGPVFEKPELNLYARDGSSWFDMNWMNRDSVRNSGEFRASGRPVPSVYPGKKAFSVDIFPSRLYFEDSLWNVSRASLLIDSSYFSVDSLILQGNNQAFLASGAMSEKKGDRLNLEFNKVNLGLLSSFVKNLPFTLGGIIDGGIEFRKENGRPVILSDLNAENFEMNGTLIGNTSLSAIWDDAQNKLSLKADGRRDKFQTLDIRGDYFPLSDRLDFDLQLNKIGISLLAPYFSAFAEDLKGEADVTATLDGTLRNPEINGTGKFDRCSMKIGYLQTVYSFSDRIRIYKNNFFFDNFLIQDEFRNNARLTGNITHNLLQDIRMNLNFTAENFRFLNTTSDDNDTFYGTVFGTGNIRFSGPVDMIRIDISARSDKNTFFYLPLYTASEVHQNDFITFIRSEADSLASDTPKEDEGIGLVMNIELTVTPDANVQLIFDPKVGDIIEARGEGKLLMTYDEKGDFKMFGEVGIEKGDYLFTLQNVINKKFEVKPGGSISWNGPPENANINLQAVYPLRVAPYNLSPEAEADESLKKRIPVECVITLMGDLMQPSITPAIEMPTADPETRNLLTNATGSEEELMKQFISLMVINNFNSVNTQGGNQGGDLTPIAAGYTTASELFSNQLSNWISQLNENFDMDINVRPGYEEVTSTELEVALTYQMFDERLIISGDVDYGTTTPTKPSSIVGNFNMEFKLNNNISVKGFNRANDDLLIETAPYTQGIGVFYREEFDTFSELRDKYKAILSGEKKKRKKKASESTGEELNE